MWVFMSPLGPDESTSPSTIARVGAAAVTPSTGCSMM